MPGLFAPGARGGAPVRRVRFAAAPIVEVDPVAVDRAASGEDAPVHLNGLGRRSPSPRRAAAPSLVILARVLPAVLRSPRPLLVVLAAAAPFALSACTQQSSGSGSFKGAQKDVQSVVTKLSDYADDRNTAAICTKLFTAKLRAEFDQAADGGCAKAVLRAVRNADYTRLAIDSIDLNAADADATRATARIQIKKDGPVRGIVLVRTGPKAPWLIDDFAVKLTQTTAATTPAATTAGTTPAASTPAKSTP